MKRLIGLAVLASACSAMPVGSASAPTAPTLAASLEGTVHADARATVATSIRFYWTEGTNTATLPQIGGTVLLPLSSTATLRAEGLDASGNPVPLTDPVWTGSGTWFTVSGTRLIATITPISVSPYDPAVLNADADSGPGVVPIWGYVQIRVVQ